MIHLPDANVEKKRADEPSYVERNRPESVDLKKWQNALTILELVESRAAVGINDRFAVLLARTNQFLGSKGADEHEKFKHGEYPPVGRLRDSSLIGLHDGN